MVHYLEVLVPDVNSVKKVTQQYFMTNQPASLSFLSGSGRKAPETKFPRGFPHPRSQSPPFSLVCHSLCLSRYFLTFAIIKYHLFDKKKNNNRTSFSSIELIFQPSLRLFFVNLLFYKRSQKEQTK